MSVIELALRIAAPRERVFDLARSVDAHLASTAKTGETAVAGKTRGLLGLGEEVTWRARHFGITQHLSSRITAYERPVHFRDSMVRGAFARFDHDHHFDADGDHTLMRDVFDFTAPLGALGTLADRLLLHRYMTRFLTERAQVLKQLAEGADWRRFVQDDQSSPDFPTAQ